MERLGWGGLRWGIKIFIAAKPKRKLSVLVISQLKFIISTMASRMAKKKRRPE